MVSFLCFTAESRARLQKKKTCAVLRLAGTDTMKKDGDLLEHIVSMLSRMMRI